MAKKVRIHDLAKQYGMSGKDLASKLRDYGFSQAKSHMSALDEFEVIQAQGVLDANGIVLTSARVEKQETSQLGGGLIVRKKKKKKKAPEEEAQTPADEAPEVPLIEVQAGAAVEVAGTGIAAARLGAPGSGAAEVGPIGAPTAEPEVTPEGALPEVAGVPVEREAPEQPVADLEVVAQASGAQEMAVAEEELTAETDEGEGGKPKGTVVGFIDPTNFQPTAAPKRKPESRRLRSGDEAAPEVRPTFGRDRGRGQGGARGKLTAAQLREREQGRFLRRSRPGGPATGRRTGARSAGVQRQELVKTSPLTGSTVPIEAPITMGKLAETLKLKSAVVQRVALEKSYGVFTVNALLDDDTATLLSSEFAVELRIRHELSAEESHFEDIKKKRSEVEEKELVDRAPIVAFLGHVDHGKTTLIDKIRETRVAEHESGGITQHIGAYQVQTSKGHVVTIIDTPGHAAFTAMRARGAQAVDIVVLVVAGDDGVKPHTEEAINHAKAAETPIVVAINKSDKAGFNANTTIQQLMGHDLSPEMYGGSTAMFETSGISGEGIDEMLGHIVLMGEAELGLKAHPKGPASGVVLEAEILRGRGIVAHLLVRDGTLNQGDVILAGEGYGRVKSILDDRAATLKEAAPSMPVEVTGLAALPSVGNPFHVVESLATAKEVAQERERKNRAVALAAKREPSQDLEAILGKAPKTERKTINLIVRCDVQGSVEVIRHEIEKLAHDEVEVKLIHSGVGPITESDVDLAATSDALLVAFHVGIPGKARSEAERNGLDVRRYEVIYELIDDLKALMEGSLAPAFEEQIIGHAEIRRLFKSSKLGIIAGCFVLDGKVTRNSLVRLLRDETTVYTGSVGSLRREKDEAKEVREGFECGIVLKDYRDIEEGDIIETYLMKEVKRTL